MTFMQCIDPPAQASTIDVPCFEGPGSEMQFGASSAWRNRRAKVQTILRQGESADERDGRVVGKHKQNRYDDCRFDENRTFNAATK